MYIDLSAFKRCAPQSYEFTRKRPSKEYLALYLPNRYRIEEAETIGLAFKAPSKFQADLATIDFNKPGKSELPRIQIVRKNAIRVPIGCHSGDRDQEIKVKDLSKSHFPSPELAGLICEMIQN